MLKRLPRQGDQVIYLPRVPYGRQSELSALVTRVWDAEKGDIDIVTFPVNSELQHFNHIARKSDTIMIHCWDFVADDPRIVELEARVAELEALRTPGKTKRDRELV